ncbi:hypothetical protein ATZ33_07395 [Enterococcus silesiacus]|uniref:YcxB-like C-terminal domain-containing protein n=1 Tax=Enterococcus silesiacus TaxID=332949 RepID=A0A0S3KAA3_9ENTE|nr:YcxB family protein [Enterococcus silesiacus]ALS01199.1 hypothetical protein ATZ33_07395 [Enterococcus silesiacus]OJG92597.1 hypothetical protein RV15_GL003022 [Enterococcus silesiacus]
MVLRFTQTLTQENWLNFNKIYMKEKNKRRRYLLLSISIISFCMFFYSIYRIWTFFQKDSFSFLSISFTQIIHYCPIDFYSALLFFIVGIELWLIYYKEIDFRIKKMLKNSSNRSFFVEKEFIITNEKIEVTTQLSTSTYEWPIFINCIETNNDLALFLNSSSILLISKKELSQEQLFQLKQLITEKMADSYEFLT